MANARYPTVPKAATGVLVLADGTVIFGRGFGAVGEAVGELCFHTAMTGYQEIMTDPSFAGQIINFTFPHIGNVGTNDEDVESTASHALGCVVREDVTAPSNFRNTRPFDAWLKDHGRIGISGVDTRALTRLMRTAGAPNAVIVHDPAGKFDLAALHEKAKNAPGLEGADLASDVTGAQREWTGGLWHLGAGYEHDDAQDAPHVVAIDYGAKDNIFRHLVKAGARVTVLPATASYGEIMAQKPAGVFLSNGPGDPAATARYAVPVIRQLLEANLPIFGICLGHQLLGLAAGATTKKMPQGHRGANHPVKRLEQGPDYGKVEITSMNHGFAIETATLPANVVETHVSLFDGSNCGIAFTDKPVFAVQYHPEASPGPQDSFYLFERFVEGLK
ncbi:MAG TPA: glutamine-hydrolyzing carbamoyl-phosphate synthase small subunit [Sphingobium sp.]|nr:glutamine-hydrolyzing carbamoyl-phosphate synthase small subunit [Sphingobium sp.]